MIMVMRRNGSWIVEQLERGRYSPLRCRLVLKWLTLKELSVKEAVKVRDVAIVTQGMLLKELLGNGKFQFLAPNR
jgi:hypothetical protein